jgi:hypothetical protein
MGSIEVSLHGEFIGLPGGGGERILIRAKTLFFGHVAANVGPESSSRGIMTLRSVGDSVAIRGMSNSATTFFSSQLRFRTSGLLKTVLPDDEPPSCLELAMCTCIAAISKVITSHVNLEAMSGGLNQEDEFRWIDFFQENCIN